MCFTYSLVELVSEQVEQVRRHDYFTDLLLLLFPVNAVLFNLMGTIPVFPDVNKANLNSSDSSDTFSQGSMYAFLLLAMQTKGISQNRTYSQLFIFPCFLKNPPWRARVASYQKHPGDKSLLLFHVAFQTVIFSFFLQIFHDSKKKKIIDKT